MPRPRRTSRPSPSSWWPFRRSCPGASDRRPCRMIPFTTSLGIILHGLRMDAAATAYVSAIPFLLVALSSVVPWRFRSEAVQDDPLHHIAGDHPARPPDGCRGHGVRLGHPLPPGGPFVGRALALPIGGRAG